MLQLKSLFCFGKLRGKGNNDLVNSIDPDLDDATRVKFLELDPSYMLSRHHDESQKPARERIAC